VVDARILLFKVIPVVHLAPPPLLLVGPPLWDTNPHYSHAGIDAALTRCECLTAPDLVHFTRMVFPQLLGELKGLEIGSLHAVHTLKKIQVEWHERTLPRRSTTFKIPERIEVCRAHSPNRIISSREHISTLSPSRNLGIALLSPFCGFIHRGRRFGTNLQKSAQQKTISTASKKTAYAHSRWSIR
jgi:hypothetical protein